jgi:hypothetical protein
MRKIIIILITLLCISCTKNNSSSEINIVPRDYPGNAVEKENLVTYEETLKENIELPVQINISEIDSYATKKLNFKRDLAFQIEGNFTGSGNKEIVAFYEYFNQGGYDINGVFCFVLDSNGEKLDKVYPLDFRTLDFKYTYIKLDSEIVLNEELGRYINWRGNVIGFFGDFNSNGIDELYLSKYAQSFGPCFFEFDGNGFKSILKLKTSYEDEFIIADIDAEKKTLDIKERRFIEDTRQRYEIIHLYIWDETFQMYELLSSSEPKYLSYNAPRRQWE